MPKLISFQLSPQEFANEQIIKQVIAAHFSVKASEIKGYQILKKSIDARSKNIKVNIKAEAYINETYKPIDTQFFEFTNIEKAKKKVLIIGAGPAGIFAALQCIKKGIKPIIIERGKDVRTRRRDLAVLNKSGVINPDSNYCFGEGGAGTYSDGKLYTRSNKRGSINDVLQTFVQFGANENILYEAHPHIGTNKLPSIIQAMRKQILDCGGIYLFEKKLTDISFKNGKVTEITTADGEKFSADYYILATGHSARDIFELLYNKNILVEQKPFALGVRIEHPQQIIDEIQYHIYKKEKRNIYLPPASYSLVQQINDRGVFSFCMCPGGIIAAAGTAPGELVVNGWSPSKRDNPYANSGTVVNIEQNHLPQKFQSHPLGFMYYQKQIEQKCFVEGGGNLQAPAQRMVDFCKEIVSSSLPKCSYIPGLSSKNLKEILPNDISQSLHGALIEFGKKMRGYFTNEAVMVATESRTSSPVRIPRDKEKFNHPQLLNLYPCGEGAGYAGGIVSAAMDGINVVEAIARRSFID